ncbi:ATP-dependent DNA ligase [Microbacterium ulmi]|uniref:DNA ligase (ATP) n=1 Tax=Microbacterium ulmi TaxID=179095 RepID=A0A7Y2LXN2_9MICO|nr:ATP-dependent DNA ligase [Microbacterium ulmi]NII71356.1 bifunctional non-homologous end joining protein LigD [Microbacterium ulmi]NNH02660.1 ATP-dependent DNA ligase [Microbacterium ulmi]
MAGGDQLVSVGGRRLRVTNLDKVLYPDTGTTKGEVLDYYSRIAPLLLPHVAGRPVTRKRWPEGVDHPSFFAKDLERGAPEWVQRMPIDHSTGAKDYPLVDDVATLVYLAQVASLELHVPQWRFSEDGGRDDPDRIVLDLDPGPETGLAECAEVARWCRAILRGMGLDPAPVTSGSKGIHLYAALPGTQTSDQVTAVARELAKAIEADHPDLVVSRMAKVERPGKVLIDWSQNNGSKTTIAPYSLRGRPQPTVAAPRTWDELDEPRLRHLRFDEVLERAERIGDPLAALGFRAGGRGAPSGPLSTYIAKRTAGKTPEPVPDDPLAPATPSGEAPRFVIQEHHATRLHWDFRLEHDGVFVSWAVPRGVPPTSERNNLAVMTEDHPLEYGSFEGTIPRGEYGAGSVTIWDDGRYDLEKWRDDEIILTAHGRPGGPLGSVRLALIRTDGQGEKSSWLLHRMKTDAAGRPQPSGQPVEPSEQADAAGSAARSHAAADVLPHSPVGSGPHGPARGRAGATSSGDGRTSEHGSEAAPPRPSDLKPMLATTSTPALARSTAARWGAWAEVKWDGIRAIGVWDGRRLRLFSRSGTDVTARYPELTRVDAQLGAEPAIVDGEIVALDAQGKPSFTRLQNRMHLTKPREIEREIERTPVRYHLFDVLSYAGQDAASLPLAQRRGILESLAAEAIPAIAVPPAFDDVDAALAASRRFALEGVVVKNPASRYRRGARSDDWLKVKLTHTQEVVVGGIRPGKGGRTGSIGSLLVGVPGPAGLQYAGRVGAGFSESTLERLDAVLTPLRADANPFVGVPAADASDALWVRPDVVAEVEFAEFTPDGILRHSRWRGLRPDKSPADVVREP